MSEEQVNGDQETSKMGLIPGIFGVRRYHDPKISHNSCLEFDHDRQVPGNQEAGCEVHL